VTRSWEPQADGTGDRPLDRMLVKDFIGEIARPLFGACIYCGWPCYGRTCPSHRDLNYVDPLLLALRGPAALKSEEGVTA
jgi:hypothetical protein